MANRIPQTFIDEVLARVDIVDLVNNRVNLRKAGSNFNACCPFHTEKSPSFTVSPTKQFYYCFGCGAHGNAIGFLMAYDKLEFVDAIEHLAHEAGLEIPQENTNQLQPQTELYTLLEKSAQFYHMQLKNAQNARKYLIDRGTNTSIIKQFNLGYAPAGWDHLLKHFASTNNKIQQPLTQAGMLINSAPNKIYDRFRDRIMFPIRDVRGRVIAFGGRTLGDETPKYLNSPETPIFHKSNELYGLYEARQANSKLEKIIIVEGYMDVVALAQYGISNAVATLGTATSNKHIQRLLRYTHDLVFCFDGDRAGKQAAWRALETSLMSMHDGMQISFVFLPENEDPDSLVRKEGTETFLSRINNATPLSSFFFNELKMQANINSVDGKAKFAKLATNLLAKIPHGVFHQLMLDKLSQVIGTDVQTALNAAVPPANQPTRKNIQTTMLSPTRLAIVLLLQYPWLAQQNALPSEYAQSDMPGISLLYQLYTLLTQNPALSTGQVLEYWRDRNEGKQLAKLALFELIIPNAGIQDEFSGALQRIQALVHDKTIQQLLDKANQGQLTPAEKQRLMQLIAQR